MKTLCTSCDVSGKEKRIGTGYTLESCKQACIADDSCLAIDFGKNGRFGECYFNYEQNTKYGSHSNFDAWTKGEFTTMHVNRAEAEVGGKFFFHVLVLRIIRIRAKIIEYFMKFLI